jgi:uncharacterized damage-inducible protein DinB
MAGRVKTLNAPVAHLELPERVTSAWRRNNDILLYLFDHIPPQGWSVRPSGSKGRDVRAQFAHLGRVRMGWVEYFETGRRPQSPRYDKAKPPAKGELRNTLTTSGKRVEEFLRRALSGEAKTRMFGRDPVRWFGYLIAHDAHHRGQILLALKQNGMRLSEAIALNGMWGKWIDGK